MSSEEESSQEEDESHDSELLENQFPPNQLDQQLIP